MVWRVDGHAVLVNATAMKLAGIDRNTRDVAGGEIVRDAAGNPTGVLQRPGHRPGGADRATPVGRRARCGADCSDCRRLRGTG